MKIKAERPYQLELACSLGRKQVHRERPQRLQKQPGDYSQGGTAFLMNLKQGVAKMIYHFILIFRFKTGQDFTPFLLLPDGQCICLCKIVQAGIIARGVSAIGLPITL